MADESSGWTWSEIVARLREHPVDTVMQIAASAIASPASAGLNPMPTGADGRKAFGAVLDAQTGLLVHVAGDNYEARLCQFPQLATPPELAASPPAPPPVPWQTMELSPPASPPAVPQRAGASLSPVPTLVESRAELMDQRQQEALSLVSLPAEQPGATMLATTLFGTLLGAALGGSKGALTGALVGGGAGLASIALSTAATSPPTSLAAQNMFLALVAASLGGRGSGPVLRLGPSRRPSLQPPDEDDDGPSRRRRLPPKK